MMKEGKRRVERKGRGRERGSEGRRLGWEDRSRGGEKVISTPPNVNHGKHSK